MPYWVVADLNNRLSVATVLRIFDDDNDGVADAGPIGELQAECDSKVDSYLQPVYSGQMAVIKATPPSEVKRLSLDLAEAICARRHAEFVKRDWAKLVEAAEHDLENLRTRKTSLGIDVAPEGTTSLDGASLISQVDDEEEPVKVFVGGMGDF